MASFGRLEEFLPEKETILNYIERVELFFQANGIANAKIVPVFLSATGENIYVLLRNLLSLTKLQDKSFEDLTAELKKHYEPKRVVIAERFNFHKRNQASDETISDFIAKLTISKKRATQKQLLTELDLTFKRAVEVAKGIEAAVKKPQRLKQAEPVEVNKFTRNSKPARPCYRCGKEGHSLSARHFKDATCHNCNKKGHIAKVCCSAKQEHPSNVKKCKKRTGTMNVVNSESEDSDSDLPVLKISGRLTHPIKVKLEIKGKPG